MTADIDNRRKAYAWIIILAILVFIVAIVDILALDSILKVGVFVALILLAILAIALLFERSEEEYEPEPEPVVLEDEEHLHCPHCAHVFAMETPKDTKNWKRKVSFACPECGQKGILPPTNATPLEAVVPGGDVKGKAFQCGVCHQGWSVGVIGHRLKKKPIFDACPSCGSPDDIRVA